VLSGCLVVDLRFDLDNDFSRFGELDCVTDRKEPSDLFQRVGIVRLRPAHDTHRLCAGF